MQIDLTKVLAQDGMTEVFQGALEMVSFDTGIECFEIIEKTPITLMVVNRGNKMLSFTGSCEVVLSVPCARCLEPVRIPFLLQPDCEIDMKKPTAEQLQELDENHYIDGKLLNVDLLLNNEILVNWPQQVLCKDDCQGICCNCGANQNLKSCDCDTDSLDPRLAAFSDIFRTFKEV